MEAWRQWLTRWETKHRIQEKNERIYLTPTGLLMEGDLTQVPSQRENREEVKTLVTFVTLSPEPMWLNFAGWERC
jgi:hypothetical protein